MGEPTALFGCTGPEGVPVRGRGRRAREAADRGAFPRGAVPRGRRRGAVPGPRGGEGAGHRLLWPVPAPES